VPFRSGSEVGDANGHAHRLPRLLALIGACLARLLLAIVIASAVIVTT